MAQTHLSMKTFRSSRSNARFSTILEHVHAWRSPMQICKDMRPYTETAFLVAGISGERFRGLTFACHLYGRSQLLRKFGPVPIFNWLAAVRCALAVTPNQMKNLEGCFWKNEETASHSSRLSTTIFSRSWPVLCPVSQSCPEDFLFGQGPFQGSSIAFTCPEANRGDYPLHSNFLVVTTGWQTLGT